MTKLKHRKRLNSDLKVTKRLTPKKKKNKVTSISKGQMEVSVFIESLGLSVEYNNRVLLSGMEIDILLPDKKIGIEYNGLYYHNEKMGKTETYHINKTKAMNKLGYGLIHIFEDEWVNRCETVKQMLKQSLDINDGIVVDIKKCKIREIKTTEKTDFLIRNHIQGDGHSVVSLGAFYGGKLIGVMCFSNDKKLTSVKSNNEYEVTRFAIEHGYSVVGMGTNLINVFEKKYKPDSIITFGDVRWLPSVSDNIYTGMGFKFVSTSRPDYMYFNPKIDKSARLPKFRFDKKTLMEKHTGLKSRLGGQKLMEDLGYIKVWDCGLFKYRKSNAPE